VSAIDQTQAAKLVNASLAISSALATTGIKQKLGTTVPTGSADMTELTGSGYTTGGTAVTWNSATPGNAATNSSAPSWTNGSGSAWNIEALELWDEAGTPLRWWYGTWTGYPVTVNNGNTFAEAAAAVSAEIT
jgi:hypothetical protein